MKSARVRGKHSEQRLQACFLAVNVESGSSTKAGKKKWTQLYYKRLRIMTKKLNICFFYTVVLLFNAYALLA
jgi:hypothetical protein